MFQKIIYFVKIEFKIFIKFFIKLVFVSGIEFGPRSIRCRRETFKYPGDGLFWTALLGFTKSNRKYKQFSLVNNQRRIPQRPTEYFTFILTIN